MANLIYVTIEGKKQGLISSGCSTFDSIGNKYQAIHKDEIFILSFEHDMNRSMNITHMPVSFIKLIDKSSPLLGTAITDNEELFLEFKFYRTSDKGGNELYYSIKIRKAFIVKLSVVYPHAINHSDNQPEELVSVKYSSIEWTHHISRTSGYSLWGESVF
ncbi:MULTISPECIES: Hcp family type VI secretion system effector [unclassified Brenneria]|uniref:Hcp family type VI secretion system effector n=1 Tax=unclassified Brenneria TaxID=2634434 RepID=UPI001556CABB|nr:Hcp family type VI secretion system effector [Brenneria sp. hezel4-2-4]MEE3651818.1 Hcp family type VI secretion system effector [Brenneria sp. HEZEL_4_2_4]NPD01777.1 Hcp family type VI secretion system effector [Brenneria sp. hezel4-2-4]